MMRFLKFGTPLLGAAAFFAAAILAAPAAQASDQSDLLAKASGTVGDLERDASFTVAQRMLRRSRAVLIIPSLVKGGFIFGAEGGNGVLLRRSGRHWSSPAFYTMGSGSFGLQIGLEKAKLVLFIMSDRALRGIENSQFKIGAGAGITVVTLSGAAEGATSGNLSGDIVVWSSATGAYGGLTLNGSVLEPRDKWNEEFYGRHVSVPEILDNRVSNPDAGRLQSDLTRAM